MQRLLKFQKQKLFLYVLVILAGLGLTMGRLVYIMVFRSEYYEEKLKICMKESGKLRQPEEKFWTETEWNWRQISLYVRSQ